MSFTLALLGTDTHFQTAFLQTEYPRGETISIVAALLAHQLPQSPLIDDGIEHLCHRNFHLINGPDTFGTQVFDRIKRGFFACVRAVIAGQTKINMIAHSRGGAEAILLAHELNRLKDSAALLRLSNLGQSSNPKLRAALTSLTWTDEDIEQLKANLADLQVAMFLLDPVPGDGYLGLGWVDPAFTVLPSIVQHFEEYVYEHERTRFFYPIIPKPHDLPGSHYVVQLLPGHHGTGSGNPYNQDKTWRTSPSPGFVQSHTEAVQDLVMTKMVYFLVSQGARFRLSSGFPPYHPDVIAILQHWHWISCFQLHPRQMRDEHLLAIYHQLVSEHAIETLRLFDQTTYPALGRCPGNSRFIHYHTEDVYLAERFSLQYDEQSAFFNREHLQTFIDSLLSLPGREEPLLYLAQLIAYFHQKMQIDPQLASLAGSSQELVQALSDAIGAPYSAGYYQSPSQIAAWLAKINDFLLCFVDQEEASVAWQIFQGLRTAFEKNLAHALNQAMLDLAQVTQKNIYDACFQSKNPRMEAAMQQISWPNLEVRAAFYQAYDQIPAMFLQPSSKADLIIALNAQSQSFSHTYGELIRPFIDVFADLIERLQALDMEVVFHQQTLQVLLKRISELQILDNLLICDQRILPQALKANLFAKTLARAKALLIAYVDTHELPYDLLATTIDDEIFNDLCLHQSVVERWKNSIHQALSNESLNMVAAHYARCFAHPKFAHEKIALIGKLAEQTWTACPHQVKNFEHLVQIEQTIKQLADLKRQIPMLQGFGVIQGQGRRFEQIRPDRALHQQLLNQQTQLEHLLQSKTQLLTARTKELNTILLTYAKQTTTKTKQDIVRDLWLLMQQPNSWEQLHAFFEKFAQEKNHLATHFKPGFWRLIDILGVVLPGLFCLTATLTSGFLAGLVWATWCVGLSLMFLALEATVIYQRRGNLYFWQPQGQHFVDKVDQFQDKLRLGLSKPVF